MSFVVKSVSAVGTSPGRRVGRPRKAGVARYAGGQIRHDARAEDVMAVAVAQRVRGGITLAGATNPLAGSAIGRLQLAGKITPDQASALGLYISAVGKLRSLEGMPRRFAATARSWDPAMGSVRLTEQNLREETDEQVERVQRLRKGVETVRAHVAKVGGAAAAQWLHEAEALEDDGFDEKTIVAAPTAISRLRVVADHLAGFYRIGRGWPA